METAKVTEANGVAGDPSELDFYSIATILKERGYWKQHLNKAEWETLKPALESREEWEKFFRGISESAAFDNSEDQSKSLRLLVAMQVRFVVFEQLSGLLHPTVCLDEAEVIQKSIALNLPDAGGLEKVMAETLNPTATPAVGVQAAHKTGDQSQNFVLLDDMYYTYDQEMPEDRNTVPVLSVPVRRPSNPPVGGLSAGVASEKEKEKSSERDRVNAAIAAAMNDLAQDKELEEKAVQLAVGYYEKGKESSFASVAQFRQDIEGVLGKGEAGEEADGAEDARKKVAAALTGLLGKHGGALSSEGGEKSSGAVPMDVDSGSRPGSARLDKSGNPVSANKGGDSDSDDGGNDDSKTSWGEWVRTRRSTIPSRKVKRWRLATKEMREKRQAQRDSQYSEPFEKREPLERTADGMGACHSAKRVTRASQVNPVDPSKSLHFPEHMDPANMMCDLVHPPAAITPASLVPPSHTAQTHVAPSSFGALVEGSHVFRNVVAMRRVKDLAKKIKLQHTTESLQTLYPDELPRTQPPPQRRSQLTANGLEAPVPQSVCNKLMEMSVATMLAHAGFDGARSQAMNALTDILGEYMTKLGKVLRATADLHFDKLPMEDLVVHGLSEMGVEYEDLVMYQREGVLRYGKRLMEAEKRMRRKYDDLRTGAGEVENDGDLDMDDPGFLSGQFMNKTEMGVDLDYLGLQEMGVGEVAVPHHLLLKGRIKKKLPPQTVQQVAREKARLKKLPSFVSFDPAKFEVPSAPPFAPIKVQDQIELLRPLLKQKQEEGGGVIDEANEKKRGGAKAVIRSKPAK